MKADWNWKRFISFITALQLLFSFSFYKKIQNHIEFISFLFVNKKQLLLIIQANWILLLDLRVFFVLLKSLRICNWTMCVHTPVNGIFKDEFTFVNISRVVKCLDQLTISRFSAYSQKSLRKSTYWIGYWVLRRWTFSCQYEQ